MIFLKTKLKTYIFSVAVALSVGLLSALFTMGSMGIYNDILTPLLAPPSWVFPVVWTILFFLMGVSAARIKLSAAPKRQKDSALRTYYISLAVNFLWSIIFFNFRAFFFAFIWLLLLLALIIITIVKYYKIDKIAAYLQIPYALWVAFAGYLTFAIWWLNK